MEPSHSKQTQTKADSSYFGMDTSELLRTFTRLDARALRAKRAHAKLELDHRATQAALKQATDELDQVSRLAEIFYDLPLRLVDQMLGARAASGNGQDRGSADAILDAVLKQIKKLESESTGSSFNEAEANASASTAATDS
ncbi:hypothetical protein N7508_007438 [Penicillium antarcticum]|uniref:uncharacterized protein n=1 Tax=Penicillium antarcticum TaxID=416450 RepID=UPI0023A636C0|nr:uncharacterized protein N7508_007389 [Penicillium antarcticum]XP_058317904.1 uncharacterized protein N7508_007438 [Penicillium antarcticum]KAJ5300146.1 hypothetical protein N7508_007389 [Penicillium antarcticum]KAJ5300195.1 hypothetical protein N7508_007438 [Penicillium antarcticum]